MTTYETAEPRKATEFKTPCDIHNDHSTKETAAKCTQLRKEAAQAPGYVIGTEDAIQGAIERDKANGIDWEGVGVIDTREGVKEVKSHA